MHDLTPELLERLVETSRRWSVTGGDGAVAEALAVLPDLVAAVRERDQLRALFDEAGQGEYNVLALVDHYQSELTACRDRLGRLHAKAERKRESRRRRGGIGGRR